MATAMQGIREENKMEGMCPGGMCFSMPAIIPKTFPLLLKFVSVEGLLCYAEQAQPHVSCTKQPQPSLA